ncbi:hypothetical transcript [Echinococcus multilocularis]|uniref:Hypothetical transcript n=1 Tax=Echinococcus multilocularis TaxID=6211 RepID=A0A068XZ49_ECHMU|nr:hypothetical transcript [Echinococcus multilocularis]
MTRSGQVGDGRSDGNSPTSPSHNLRGAELTHYPNNAFFPTLDSLVALVSFGHFHPHVCFVALTTLHTLALLISPIHSPPPFPLLAFGVGSCAASGRPSVQSMLPFARRTIAFLFAKKYMTSSLPTPLVRCNTTDLRCTPLAASIAMSMYGHLGIHLNPFIVNPSDEHKGITKRGREGNRFLRRKKVNKHVKSHVSSTKCSLNFVRQERSVDK